MNFRTLMAQTHELKYEEALKRLEKLVAELDKSELDLDSRLKRFEEGTKLARALLKKLEQAKKKVELLVKTDVGDATLAPFDDDLDEDEREHQDA
jgi:exodeoxyribonuclease VII small subunit